MPKMHTEIRIIWLSVLMLTAIITWYLDIKTLSYVFIAIFVSSIMYVVAAFSQSTTQAKQPTVFHQNTSKVPLYIASGIAAIGAMLGWLWLVALGISTWLYFFLAWLRRLEQQQQQIVHYLAQQQRLGDVNADQMADAEGVNTHDALSFGVLQTESSKNSASTNSSYAQTSLMNQMQQWLFQGNPVLKVAIVVLFIGVILLLRFATEHWQMNLAAQLMGLSCICVALTGLGYRLRSRNRGFALGLQGLGMAGLYLTLFFAHYNLVLASVTWSVIGFCVLMAVSIYLSLRQNSVELAIMAIGVAYIAPFSLPEKEMTSTMMLIYLSVINVSGAILSSIRPWKVLNQIALLLSTLIGSSYVFYFGHFVQWHILILILFNLVIFIWVGLRYSQLLAKTTQLSFQLKSILDLALIFSAPLIAYAQIYLLYFQDSRWQAGLSLVFAVIYAGLGYYQRQLGRVSIIAHSYLSLSFIFLSFIPAILLPAEWTAIGWAVLGVLALVHAVLRQSNLSQYLSMGLLIVAGLTVLYEFVVNPVWPSMVLWGLVFSYVVVVIIANFKHAFHVVYQDSSIIFHALIFALAQVIALFLLGEDWALDQVMILLILAVTIFILNAVMRVLKAGRTWELAKMMGIVPILLYAVLILHDRYDVGRMDWSNLSQRVYYAIACGLLFVMILIPRAKSSAGSGMNDNSAQDLGRTIIARLAAELRALTGLLSLAFASAVLYQPSLFVSMMLLPLAFAGWTYYRQTFYLGEIWKTQSSLLLLLLWIFSSQCLEMHAFQLYVLPVFNPFDFISLLASGLLLLLLHVQYHQRIDRGLIALTGVVTLLWLSSFILLRALHFYIDRPYNEWDVWSDMTIQMSLSLLWSSIAFLLMMTATLKKHRYIWIVGASVLVIVTLKLILIDLSHVGALTRVFSFLGAGGVMLVTAYIAPIPEKNEMGASE